MTKQEIIDRVKQLNLADGTYVVFGSCPLAVLGLREANDVDLLVNEEVFEKFRREGWKQVEKSPNDKPLTKDVVEAHAAWDFTSYKPTLEHLLKTVDIIDSIPFASIEEVRKWKVSSGRPKDFEDIKLIDNYLTDKK